MKVIKITFTDGTTITHLVNNQDLLILIDLFESAGIKYQVIRLVD